MTKVPAQVKSTSFYQETIFNLTGMDADSAEKYIIIPKIKELPIEIKLIRKNIKIVFKEPAEQKIFSFVLRRRSGKIKVHELDQLLSTTRLYADVRQVMSEEAASKWITKPNRHLDNQTPAQLLQTHIGEKRVYDYLDNLLSGNFA